MTSHHALPARVWTQIALLALLWGASFLAMRIALDSIGPHWIVAHRTFWAAAVLWVAARALRLPVPRGVRVWGAFAVMGLLNNIIPFTLIAWGQQHIETGLAAILNASTAIWGVLVAALFLADERLTARRALGVSIGFAGVVTVIGPDSLTRFDPRSLGQLAVLGASLSYALAGVWARRHLRGVAPQMAATGMLTASALIALPLAWLLEGPPLLALDARIWGAIGYFSVVSTALAYLLYYRILASAGSGNTMLTTLLVAPVAIVLGAAVRGEALAPAALLGLGLLALGLALLDGRLWRALRTRKKPLEEPPLPR